MDTFRWLTVVVSIILGLGIARQLTSAVALFHSRRKARLDWVPIAWAALIFLQQVGFWWALEELSTLMPKWSLPNFLLLVCLVLTLFLAAALVLPAGEINGNERLKTFFEEDGRFALLAVAAFNSTAIVANWLFWHDSPFTRDGLLNVALAALALVAFASRRPVRVAATLAYTPLLLFTIATLAPQTY